MNVCAVLVVHREPIAAEALAMALDRIPALLPVGAVSSGPAAERLAGRADAAVVDERLPDADVVARRLRRSGVRVVMLGDRRTGEEDGIRVRVDAPLAELAAALVPGCVPPGRLRALSRRQEEILRLAARGLAGKQIANHLGISPKTVEQHKSSIFRKLGVPNQAAAVALATGEGRLGWNPFST